MLDWQRWRRRLLVRRWQLRLRRLRWLRRWRLWRWRLVVLVQLPLEPSGFILLGLIELEL